MKLTDKIHLLQIDFEIAITPEKKLARFVNVIIIFGDKITLVDTGVKGSEEKIFAYIKQYNRNLSDIETIILSHSHPDHIGSANKIKDLTNCEILSHENEVDWIENIDLQNKLRPVPGFYNLVDHSVKVDRRLQNGQELEVARDVTLQIWHAPGHSKGSLNIMFKEDRILFTADSIPLQNDIPNYNNFPDLMNSLKAIKENNHYRSLLTSWTPPLTNLSEIKKLISDGEEYMTKIDQTVKEIYTGNEPEPFIFCRKTIEKLGLPPFLVTPVVDQAFRSHTSKGTLKICEKGHQFYKSSNCPTCPVCEDERKPKDSFLALIGAPARRALERENIKTLADLVKWSEKEILKLHGMGPGSIPKLTKALKDNGLSFKS